MRPPHLQKAGTAPQAGARLPWGRRDSSLPQPNRRRETTATGTDKERTWCCLLSKHHDTTCRRVGPTVSGDLLTGTRNKVAGEPWLGLSCASGGCIARCRGRIRIKVSSFWEIGLTIVRRTAHLGPLSSYVGQFLGCKICAAVEEPIHCCPASPISVSFARQAPRDFKPVILSCLLNGDVREWLL